MDPAFETLAKYNNNIPTIDDMNMKQGLKNHSEEHILNSASALRK